MSYPKFRELVIYGIWVTFDTQFILSILSVRKDVGFARSTGFHVRTYKDFITFISSFYELVRFNEMNKVVDAKNSEEIVFFQWIDVCFQCGFFHQWLCIIMMIMRQFIWKMDENFFNYRCFHEIHSWSLTYTYLNKKDAWFQFAFFHSWLCISMMLGRQFATKKDVYSFKCQCYHVQP